jgi:hypothetical protein
VVPDPSSDDAPRPSAASEFEESAARLRVEAADADALLHALVDRLDAVPGLTVTVTYRHGRVRRLIGDIPYVNDLHRRTDPIDRIVVTLGPVDYWVTAADGSVRCGADDRSAVRPGSGDDLPFGAWAERLFDDIVTQNHANQESLAALRALIEHDRT